MNRSFPQMAIALCMLTSVAAQAAANWTINPSRTHIAFDIDAVGYPRTHGEFHKFEGKIAVDLANAAASRVSFHVASASVDVGSSAFADFIRGPAMLDVQKFPAIDFASTKVEKLDEHRVRVVGDLTLLGVTHPLDVDVDVERQGENGHGRLGFVAKAVIHRLDFGMNSGFPVISNDVDLVISSEAVEN